MLTLFLQWLLFLGSLGGLSAMPKAVADEAEPPALCPAELSAAIDSVTAAPPFERARWGILVQPLASQRPLYSHNSEHYFIPASTVKLLTTAAALLELGSPFQMRTSVYGILSPTVTSLRVVGRGDPTLTTEQLQELAQQLQEQGIQRIKQLEVAEGYLGGPRLNPTWEWEDVYAYYGSAVNSLILNQNTFTLTLLPQQLGQPVKILGSDPVAMQQWRIDNQATTAPAGTTSGIEISGVLGQPVLTVAGELALDEPPDIWQLAIADPSRYFLETFRRLLMRSGIPVEQARITAVAGPPGVELAAVQSPPLAELIGEINRSSNNLFAEVLLQHLARRGDRFETIEQQLTALGVAPDSYVLADGSGLSRHNLVSPQALVQTLRLMAQTSEADSYRQSLAVAGVSGTLKRRFQNTALQGMQAKTGTLNGVAALAGYLTPPHYPPLAFSILLNQSHQPPAVQRAALDRIALLLGQLKEC